MGNQPENEVNPSADPKIRLVQQIDFLARKIDAAKNYVVSSRLDRVDWNAELVRGDLGMAVTLALRTAVELRVDIASLVRRSERGI